MYHQFPPHLLFDINHTTTREYVRQPHRNCLHGDGSEGPSGEGELDETRVLRGA